MSTVKKRTRTNNSSQPSKKQHLQSSYTLYISNLNSKINKSKLIENLYILLSSFADVIQISHSGKFRGQVWVAVSSSHDALQCIENLNGFNIFDKDMKISMAEKESKLINNLQLTSTST